VFWIRVWIGSGFGLGLDPDSIRLADPDSESGYPDSESGYPDPGGQNDPQK
jgi:hypothetical protein